MSDGGPCGLTVMRTTGGRFSTKQWRWQPATQQWTKISYDAGAWFHATEHAVGSLQDLAAVLDKVRHDPAAFVVRGALAPWARSQLAAFPERPVRRRKHQKNGIEPPLVETDRRWIMLDVDNWPLPPWADLADDPDAAIEHAIRELLPAAFHEAECWWQLSASAGFVPGVLKAHLFFWLKTPASNAQIKGVLKQHAPGIDGAPFNAAQPHYIADPIIEGGHDPIPRRTGWRKGLDDAVELPALRPSGPSPIRLGGSLGKRPGGAMERALAVLGHGDGFEGFHAPIRASVLVYARMAARGGERNDTDFKDWLRVKIRAAPRRAGEQVETPYCQDYYLQASIDGALALIAGDADSRPMQPHYPLGPLIPIEAARVALARHVGGFLGRKLDWHRLAPEVRETVPPEHAALIITPGAGKTSVTVRMLVDDIAAAKAAGVPHRVLILVPYHKLGAQMIAALRAVGIHVAGLYGREADIPGSADTERDVPAQKMCLDLPAVRDATSIGLDVEKSVCGSGKPGAPSCVFRGDCEFQRRKAEIAAADVVVGTHAALFGPLLKIVTDGVGLVICDEGWWQGGVRKNIETRLADFAEQPTLQPVRQTRQPGDKRPPGADQEATNDLHTLALRAQAAFSATPDGALVSRQTVFDAGLSAADCAEAAKLEWRRKVEGTIWPGMTTKARKKAVIEAAGNASLGRRVGIWHALGDLLTGDVSHTGRLQMGSRKDGGAHRVILSHTRAEISAKLAALPMLLLDATMPEAVVRHYLPRLKVLANIAVAMPVARVHQVTGGSGKTTLVPHAKASDEENARRERKLAELKDFVRLHGGGNALVITYQDIEGRFAEPGISTEHFGAATGLDCHGDVRAVFIIGRPMADPAELRPMALALTGKPISAEEGHRETRGATMEDGTGRAVAVRTYSDPDLEALHTAITGSEVIQGIGRARGVNRTAERPLDVYVFADVVLPLALASLSTWESARPCAFARMAARGVVLASPADASAAYPDLFPTADAYRKSREREDAKGGISRTFPYDEISIGESPGNTWVQVLYRPAGRGQQTRPAQTRPAHLPSLKNWLEGVCKAPLSLYAVDPFGACDAQHPPPTAPVVHAVVDLAPTPVPRSPRPRPVAPPVPHPPRLPPQPAEPIMVARPASLPPAPPVPPQASPHLAPTWSPPKLPAAAGVPVFAAAPVPLAILPPEPRLVGSWAASPPPAEHRHRPPPHAPPAVP